MNDFLMNSPLSPSNSLELKVENLETEMKSRSALNSSLGFTTGHSPGGLNLRLTVPKKHYSVQRNDSLQFMVTPVFDKTMIGKKTPSSPGTVLTVAGLFVVGFTLVLSGIIIIWKQSEQPFRVCGSLFIGVGVTMLLICTLLQRKNIVKFVQDLNQDLYFLNMGDSYMWKLMSTNRNELPEEPHENEQFSHF